ncbi:MAG: NAD(P)-binding domain-containing protein [Candidatus Sulfotelmatobacter sp.]|jgi:thioredoxin reductase
MLETAIIGSGPYGLSIAAHFRRRGIPFRIFGRVMDSWQNHMPKGMCLKSEGFASNLYDPEHAFTLATFCAERGIDYADSGLPVRLDTFSAYGQAFRERMAPELEDKLVVGLDRGPNGFQLTLDDGEMFAARRVILAVGITHFEYLPAELSGLPAELCSHSFQHHALESFRGRSVVVIGGGSSATDLAGLLHEAGAEVQLVSRQSALKFHGPPQLGKKSLWQRFKRPQSGIGPGWRHRFLANAPNAFHFLPESLRLEAVRRILGPSGAYFVKDKVVGKIPLQLGYKVQGTETQNGRLRLHLSGEDGSSRQIAADHVIAATGYKVNLNRLKFLSPEIRSQVECVGGSPMLSSSFQSSVPGLYFAGLASANSFGPVMRFAFGAGFAARTLTHAMAKSRVRTSVAISSTERPLHQVKTPEQRQASHTTDQREKAGAASHGSSR